MKKWSVVIVLALAQFVMVLDSSVMNVSISQIVADLDTTVSGIQLAITLYTLVMAALMLTGGRLGDIWGRRRSFKIGLIVYGIGSFITGLSVGLPMLLFGWSFIEGLGAIMVVPAIAALIAINYKGKERVLAYSIIGGVSGAAVAAGPLIGGAITTYLSWRYVFFAETVVVLGIFFLFANKIKDLPVTKKTSLDFWSILLSSSGLFLIVLAILQSKTWGWVIPKAAPIINGYEITPFGLSIVPFMIVAGIIILWFFSRRQRSLVEKRKSPLLDVSILRIPHMQAGLSNISIQYLLTAGLFFILPIYLQMVLGLDALSTGIEIIPLSIALIIFSLGGARLANRFSAKRIIGLGKLAIIAGLFLLLYSITPDLRDIVFKIGLFFIGAGVGLMASQIGNVIQSSVPEEQSSEAGGLGGTFQNLGASLGTALIGSVLIASLTTGFVDSATSPESTLPQNVQDYITDNTKDGVAVVSDSQVYDFSISQGLSPDEATEISDYYQSAQMKSLKISILALALLAILGLLFSRKLPKEVGD